MKTAILPWLPASAVMAVIFFASSLPGERVPLPHFQFSDKAAHICVYALLGLSLGWRWRLRPMAAKTPPESPSGPGDWDWNALFIGLIYAASDEIHQVFVPGRMAGLGDWLADALGLFLGLAVNRHGRKRWEKAGEKS